MNIKIIAFDADDTLWHNEGFFREIEKKFCELLTDYMAEHSLAQELLKTEIGNLPLYGYGIKGFTLSLIETAINVSGKNVPAHIVEKILEFGKDLLQKPVDLLEDVEHVLAALHSRYRLVMATKGDLLDQHRKLRKSGLGKFFHHIEIMSEKSEEDYRKLIGRLDIKTTEFAMVGNSLKSDIMPPLAIGAHAFHIPYHTTWAHEHIEIKIANPQFRELRSIKQLLDYL